MENIYIHVVKFLNGSSCTEYHLAMVELDANSDLIPFCAHTLSKYAKRVMKQLLIVRKNNEESYKQRFLDLKRTAWTELSSSIHMPRGHQVAMEL